jgi:autotransporter adhesin
MAVASLPQPYRPQQRMVGVALGSFHGQAGVAVGVSTITDDGSWVLKANASANTTGNVGMGVGAGFIW